MESAPAIVFLKDPGLKPVVYHGKRFSSIYCFIFVTCFSFASSKVNIFLAGFFNHTMFTDIMEDNKHYGKFFIPLKFYNSVWIRERRGEILEGEERRTKGK